jgi:hypothetical protein
MFSGDPLRPHTVVDGLHDHFVLGNRVEAVDAGVIGEGFVVVGDDAVGLRFPQFPEGDEAQVAIQQEVFARGVLLRMDHERFDHADFFDGVPDGLVSADVLLGVLDLADREDVRQRNPDLAHFESNFHFTHAASFWLIVILS